MAAIELATPAAAVVGAAGLFPIAAAAIRERRDGAARRLLGLGAPRRGARFASALAGAGVVALLATAAAQPRLRLADTVRIRSDAQLLFLVDVSRSMLARRGPNGPTRFARAQELAIRVRGAVPEVPSGVASLSDWALLHLPPSADQVVFARVVRNAVGIERPPPFAENHLATDLSALADVALSPFFAPEARHRILVLLSDGESIGFDPVRLAVLMRSRHVRLLVVRLWHPDEAIYLRGGTRDAGYRPDARSLGPVQTLAAAAGGRVFGDGDAGAIAAAIRDSLGSGPTRAVAREERFVPLAPYVVAAAVLPLLLALRLRDARTPSRRRAASAAGESPVPAPPAPPP